MIQAQIDDAAEALKKDLGDFTYAQRIKIASVVLTSAFPDLEESIRINQRGNRLASAVCDIIWGGEHAWERATDAQFESLLSAARQRMNKKE